MAFILLQLFNASIFGTVTNLNADRVQGVAIHIKNSSIGTYSNGQGDFVIKRAMKPLTLIVSCAGYKRQEIHVRPQTKLPLNIQLIDSVGTEHNVIVEAKRYHLKHTLNLNEYTESDLKTKGFNQVTDLIQSEPSIQFSENKGFILRGFDPEYTLVMLDGNPIGNQSVSADLSEIPTENIASIELVKGPSSFLYGNQALAGSINIITKSGKHPFLLTPTLQFKSKQQRVQSSIWFESSNKSTDLSIFLKASKSIEGTHERYTFQPKLKHYFTDQIFLQSSLGFSFINAVSEKQGTITKLENLAQSFQNQLNITNERFSVKLSHSIQVNANFANEHSDSVTYQNSFKQWISDQRLTGKWLILPRLQLISEIGSTFDKFEGSAINDTHKKTHNVHSLIAVDLDISFFKIMGGLRYNYSENYAAGYTPHIGLEYQASPKTAIRASFGKGFKSPSISELYHYYSPENGLNYVVLGSNEFQSYVKNKTVRYLIDRKKIGTLSPETSSAYTLDVLFKENKFSLKTSLFYNQLYDHILLGRVAFETLDEHFEKPISSYYNIDELVTYGFETEFHWKISETIAFSASYNYLDTFEPFVARQLKSNAKHLTYIHTYHGQEIPLKPDDYLGLFDRSKHNLTFNINYQHPEKWGIHLSGRFFGSSGYEDTNQNQIYDKYDTPAPGYTLLNLFIRKVFKTGWVFGIQSKNLLNITNTSVREITGRTYDLTLSFTLKD